MVSKRMTLLLSGPSVACSKTGWLQLRIKNLFFNIHDVIKTMGGVKIS